MKPSKTKAARTLFLCSLLSIACLLITACFAPLDYKGAGNTTISINLGGSAARSAFADSLTYKLVFSGPEERSITEWLNGGRTVTVQAVPGIWVIDVEAFHENEVIAQGTASEEVLAGQNHTVIIQMGFVQANVLAPFLTDAPGGTQDEPVNLHLTMELSQVNWLEILQAIENANKFVNLNLSECTRHEDSDPTDGGLQSDGAFNPISGITTGKNFVVSMILPEAAESIVSGNSQNPAFNHFSNLIHVTTGNGIKTIGAAAFAGLEIISITIVADVQLESDSFDHNFAEAYNLNGRQAGIYIWNDSSWRSELTLPLLSFGEIVLYLDSHTGGVTADDAIDLPLRMQLTEANWNGILTSLQSAEKFVNLDMSACTRSGIATGGGLRSGGEFDPIYTNTTGKGFVVSLTLPEEAESVVDGEVVGPIWIPDPDRVPTFIYFTNLKHLKTGDGIRIIGIHAFLSVGLTNVDIGNNVFSIGEFAFCNNQLNNLVLPDSVTSIGYAAFLQNNLSSIIIPNSVTTIGINAFGNNKLTSVTIPGSISYLTGLNNNELTSIVIPDSVTTIGEYAFRNNQLTSITIGENVTSIEDNAFANNSITNVIIPDSVNTIGNSAFNNNQLTSVIIGNGVTEIESSAFNNNQLISVIIPDSVTAIGDSAFRFNQLTSVTIGENVTSIEAAAFDNNQITSIVIPDSVVLIGNGTFSNNQLVSVTIGNSVTSIGTLVFANNKITSITIPNSVETIGFSAFADNPLNSVTFEQSGITVDQSAFPENLSTVYTANGAGIYIFADNTWNFISEHLSDLIPFLTNHIGGNTADDAIDLDMEDLQLTETNWRGILAAVHVAGKYVNLDLSACTDSGIADGGGLRENGTFDAMPAVTIGKGLIVELVLPDTAETIGGIGNTTASNNHFTSLRSASGIGVTNIGEYAFAYCSNLTSVSFPLVTSLGSGAFWNCSNLVLSELPAGITEIGPNTFRNAESLTQITLHAGISPIGNGAFQGCTNLNLVTVLAAVPPELGSAVFDGTDDDLVIMVSMASLAAYKAAPNWIDYENKIFAFDGQTGITFYYDAGQNAFTVSQEIVIISRTGNIYPSFLEIAISDPAVYTSPRWYVNGILRTEWNDDDSIIINASDYPLGGHSLSLWVVYNSLTWSKEMVFRVEP